MPLQSQTEPKQSAICLYTNYLLSITAIPNMEAPTAPSSKLSAELLDKLLATHADYGDPAVDLEPILNVMEKILDDVHKVINVRASCYHSLPNLALMLKYYRYISV